MHVDLGDLQTVEHHGQGKITGADGQGYSRGSKAKRRVCDQLIEAGAPLVLDMYGSGQFDWFDGNDAVATWADVRPYVSMTLPTSAQLAKHEMWIAQTWESDEGAQLLHLTGYC